MNSHSVPIPSKTRKATVCNGLKPGSLTASGIFVWERETPEVEAVTLAAPLRPHPCGESWLCGKAGNGIPPAPCLQRMAAPSWSFRLTSRVFLQLAQCLWAVLWTQYSWSLRLFFPFPFLSDTFSETMSLWQEVACCGKTAWLSNCSFVKVYERHWFVWLLNVCL